MPRCPTCHRRIPEATPCPSDGGVAPAWVVPDDVARAQPPEIPGFFVQDRLGMGGFSIVWRAIRDRDPASAAQLAAGGAPGSARRLLAAIKVARGDSPVTVERFRRDADALARIGPPSTPRLYASGLLDDGRPFIAMELLVGKPLSDRLDVLPGPPDAAWIARVAAAILDAIGAAHARGLLHRDLKPENIFLDDAGRRATLIDFGLTKAQPASGETSSITGTGTVVGTPEYMAPEQIRGDADIDARIDIYAFGVILYELCTLRIPFVGDRASIEHGHVALRPPRPREFAAIPPALEELILACLAKERARRPADVGAVRKALLEAVPPGSMSALSASSGSAPPPGSRPSSSKARLLAEGKRPVVILVIETNAAVLPVSAAVGRYGGFIARQRASSYVCVFSGVDIEDPTRAGISSAREVVLRFGARAALHVASLAMRRQENAPPTVYGAAVERPETWMPSMPGWSGILVTADLARLVDESELAPAAENDAFVPLLLGGPLSDGAVSLPWDTDPLSMTGVIPRSSGPPTEVAARSSRGRSLSSSTIAVPESASPSRASSQGPWSKPWSQPMTEPSPDAPPTQLSAMPPPLTQRSPRAQSAGDRPREGERERPGSAEEGTPSSQPLTQPSMLGLPPWRLRGIDGSGGDELSRGETPPEASGRVEAPPHQSETRRRSSDGLSAVRPAEARSSLAPSEAASSTSEAPLTEVDSAGPSLRSSEAPSGLSLSGPVTEPAGPPTGVSPVYSSVAPPSGYGSAPSSSGSRSSTGPTTLAQRLPLFGRDDVLAKMAESAQTSFEGLCPGLFTIVGESGLGKTRLAGEAIGVVDRLRPGAAVIFQRAAQPLADVAGATTRELLGRVMGVQGADVVTSGFHGFGAPPPADPRLFCRDRLGEELGEEAWRAVAVTMGWDTAEALSVSPGAIQRGAMLALTEGLRRLSREGPVVLVLDDAHWADDTALDALEYATLNAEGCPLWVVVAAQPRFETLRRGWGTRAQRHDRVALDPLSEEAGMQLAAELLLPAEYPPAATLKRLADWAGGNPSCLAELAKTLKRAGIVRQRPNLGTWYVATAELDKLPPSTAWQWLAVRQLDGLAPELAACVRLCSVMGVEFTRAEVEWVQDAMEREGVAATPMDIGVGLGSLVERRILMRGTADRYSFHSSTFQDAVYKLLDAAHRERIHKYALQYFRGQRGEVADAPRVLDRLARHAGACGAREEAAEAYLALGDAARGKHRHVEADQHYTAALTFLEEGDTRRRALALAGRGKGRYRVHRNREALDDLREARELAVTLGDDELTADILLEEATALDFANDFVESAKQVEKVRALVEQCGEHRLQLRFWAALGRSCFHQEKISDALELLQRSADGAKDIGDYETRVVSLLFLAPLLLVAGHLSQAEDRYSEVINLCVGAEDRVHLCAVYINRFALSIAKKQRDEAMSDLRRAIQLAREVGNPWSECIATHNIAEFLHWLGEEDVALSFARRVHVLEERFLERQVSYCSLLLARIHASCGNYEEACKYIDWISERCAPSTSEPATQALFHAMKRVLLFVGAASIDRMGETITWDEIIEKASGGMFAEELLEVLYWRAWTAVVSEQWEEVSEALRQSDARLNECPMWPLRFANLKNRLLLRQPLATAPESGRTADSGSVS